MVVNEEHPVLLSFSKKRIASRRKFSHFKRVKACEAMNT